MRTIAKTITTEVKLPDPEDVILTITDSGPGSEPPHQKNIVLTSSLDPSIQLNVTNLVDQQTKDYFAALISQLCGVYEDAKVAELDAKSADVAVTAEVIR